MVFTITYSQQVVVVNSYSLNPSFSNLTSTIGLRFQPMAIKLIRKVVDRMALT